MSSILDALKRAEQESANDREPKTPWPAPLSAQSSSRQSSTRRWWVPLGIVVLLCAVGVVLWQTRQPDTSRPAASFKAVPSSPTTHDNAPLSAAQEPNSNLPITETMQVRTTKTTIETAAPIAEVQPVIPQKISSPDARLPTTPMVQPPPLPLENAQPLTVIPEPEPVMVPPAAPIRRSVEITDAERQLQTGPPDRDKTFRNDPRIDLQALVWAPQAAERFVVINNRLVKEGGTVDNIVVVRINQDDVLLSEESDRWHEKFKVR